MRFRQPNNLARAMHQVLNDLAQRRTVELRFNSEAEVHHVLEVLREVAQERRVLVNVRSVGRRTLEFSLDH